MTTKNRNKPYEQSVKESEVHRHINIRLLFDCRGLNPAECEVNFLKIVKNMSFYGVDMHSVVVSNLSGF